MMKAYLGPFGSYLYGESRDQDFVAFRELPPGLEGKAHRVEPEGWSVSQVAEAALQAGFPDPDVWLEDQEGDMKAIIVANLMKDYPDFSGWFQEHMDMRLDIHSGTDPVLLASMDANVARWERGPFHLVNLRKVVFSRAQREAYRLGLGFLNSKSEIARAISRHDLGIPGYFDDLLYGDSFSREFLAEAIRFFGGDSVRTYTSVHGCICELPKVGKYLSPSRSLITPIEEGDGIVRIIIQEVYTYRTRETEVELENEVWEMLLRLDLEEVKP